MFNDPNWLRLKYRQNSLRYLYLELDISFAFLTKSLVA